MENGKDLLKKPIYDIENGKKVGDIKDILIDNEAIRVRGVYLGREGLLSRKHLAIASSSVKVMGVDCWLVSGSDVIQDVKELPEADKIVYLDEFKGRQIITDGETVVGTIGDIRLNDQGEIKAFLLGKVNIQGPVADHKLIARAAVTSLGDKKRPMRVDLSLAEQHAIVAKNKESAS